MTVTLKWYDDAQTTLIYEFKGAWTWSDYDEARAACRRLLDTVDYGIDQIYDFTHAPVPPSGSVSKFWQVATTKHENTSGLIVVVGNNKLTQMLANTVGSLINRAIRNFDISYVTNHDAMDEHLQKRRAIHRAD
ncbi:MAG: hypothetical protein AAF846_27120 [Chloroflexota bacterium]